MMSEIRHRAEIVARAMDDIPGTWRLRPPSRQRTEHLARVGWFHEQLAGLYGRVEHAIEGLRRGDWSGVETLVRFLEADVYCFRSGYVKAEASFAPTFDSGGEWIRRHSVTIFERGLTPARTAQPATPTGCSLESENRRRLKPPLDSGHHIL